MGGVQKCREIVSPHWQMSRQIFFYVNKVSEIVEIAHLKNFNLEILIFTLFSFWYWLVSQGEQHHFKSQFIVYKLLRFQIYYGFGLKVHERFPEETSFGSADFAAPWWSMIFSELFSRTGRVFSSSSAGGSVTDSESGSACVSDSDSSFKIFTAVVAAISAATEY